MAYRKLTTKQRLFVEYYLQCWNATRAAELAGYSGTYATLAVIGSENLRKPNIWAKISARIDEIAMSSDEVLIRLASMARGFDVTKYVELKETFNIREGEAGKFYREFSGYTLRVDLKKLEKDGFSHLIKKIKQSATGNIEIEWHNQMDALVHIGRHHGTFKDITEHRGAIRYEDVGLTDEERKERVSRVLGIETTEVSGRTAQ